MSMEERLLDSCDELLSEYRNILFKLNNQNSWRLRTIRFRLQCLFREDTKKLESAMSAYPLSTSLMDAEEGTPELDELEMLATLVELYEELHFPIDLPDPIEAMRFRMEMLSG
jgi:hypothetical protein